MQTLMAILGVSRDRLVFGPTCVHQLYIPEPPACANRGPSPMHAAMMRRELQHALGVPRDGASPVAVSPSWVLPLEDRHVLLVQRCCERRVLNFEALRWPSSLG